MTDKKSGIAKLMITIAANSSRLLLRNVSKDLGTRSSIMSISFENLLTILPKGVASKNAIGECRTLVSNPWWSLSDALTELNAWTKQAKRTKTAWEKPSPPYKPRSRVCCVAVVSVVEELLQWASQMRAAADQHSANSRNRRNDTKSQHVEDLM